MQNYNYRIDMKVYRCNMFKETCLIALKRKDWSHRLIDLEILVCLILKSLYDGSKTNSPNAQAYNHTYAIIIRIGLAGRERGHDSKNFGTRITYFGVTVEKISGFEVLGLKLEF
jgi:hypothetical protein